MKIRSKKLNKAIDEFTKAMKQRLAQKEREGLAGWNDEEYQTRNSLIYRANEKFESLRHCGGKKNAVDVANFMMMIFHRENQ